MTRGVKWLLVILILFAAIFAGGSGFFYAKTVSLEKELNNKDTVKDTTASKVTETAASTAAVSTTPATPPISEVSTSSTDSRPSSPLDTVVVGEGETLFAIGQKVGVSWTQIAAASGIDADKIKIGQTLIVPKNNQIGYTVNKDKATSLQKDVDGGKYQFRLSALDTAKADAPTAYGLVSTDNFTQTKIDVNSGSATVSVVKDDKTYTITLLQPSTKGVKGIWAIDSIKLAS